MALKNVRSVAAGGSGSRPCGTSFEVLLYGQAAPLPVIAALLPAQLLVTFDDASTANFPISWNFGAYDPWDNIGRVVKLKGNIVLPQKSGVNNVDDLRNDNQVQAEFTLTTTPLTGKLDPLVGAEDCFLNRPGQPTAN